LSVSEYIFRNTANECSQYSLRQTGVISGITRGVKKPVKSGRHQNLVTSDWNLQERVTRVTLSLPMSSQLYLTMMWRPTQRAVRVPLTHFGWNPPKHLRVARCDGHGYPSENDHEYKGVTQEDNDAIPKIDASRRDWEQREVRRSLLTAASCSNIIGR